MYGWRAKIGLIVPSLNNTMEPELNKMAPSGVAIYATRLLLEKGLPENLGKMATDTEQATDLLKTADVTGILYGCTSGSLIKGLGWDQEIIRRMEDRTGVPATTTSTAVIEAFKELGVKSVAVATPYVEAVNKIEKDFFEAHGITVVNIQGLGYTTGGELHREPPETAYAFAREVNREGADCLFISCTDFATIEVLNVLERDVNKPVMSSNTASIWSMLRKLGIKDRIDDYGEILRRL
jgi:maleate cis-trans isomerase